MQTTRKNGLRTVFIRKITNSGAGKQKILQQGKNKDYVSVANANLIQVKDLK